MKNKRFKFGIISAVVAAICCFTPVLVILFGAAGLSALVVYLDYVLLPWLFLSIVAVMFMVSKQRK
ncbi:MAG: mercury resistance system transport protein MerF [Rhizobiales bacterium]|nr:mercury resistance system transport protein MerF [Hyphomicrobiales bacterium]